MIARRSITPPPPPAVRDQLGATDIVAERGDDGIARIQDLTEGVAPT